MDRPKWMDPQKVIQLQTAVYHFFFQTFVHMSCQYLGRDFLCMNPSPAALCDVAKVPQLAMPLWPIARQAHTTLGRKFVTEETGGGLMWCVTLQVQMFWRPSWGFFKGTIDERGLMTHSRLNAKLWCWHVLTYSAYVGFYWNLEGRMISKCSAKLSMTYNNHQQLISLPDLALWHTISHQPSQTSTNPLRLWLRPFSDVAEAIQWLYMA